MSKAMDRFLDKNGPIVFDALKSNNAEHFNQVMDRVFEEFLNVNITPAKRKPTQPKRRVRRGIGSY